MRVLITGASGMVGKNLLEHSAISEFEVLKPTRAELDLSLAKNVEDYLKKHKPEIIVHAAGHVGGIQDNIKNPVDFLVDNIDINRNLIVSSFKVGIKSMLNLGSSCMYPRNSEEALSESMILKGELEPTNEGYALAKVMAQRLCEYIMRQNPEFKYKTLIPCNLYGRFDKFNPEQSHLVPAVIRKIHEAKISSSDVEIWGDGTARREFMYAGDLADCILKSLKEFDSIPDLMNVGLGHDYTINEYYQEVAKVVGYEGTFKHNTAKPVGMKRKLISVDLMDKWGWKSSTSLKEGLEKTYEHFLSLSL